MSYASRGGGVLHRIVTWQDKRLHIFVMVGYYMLYKYRFTFNLPIKENICLLDRCYYIHDFNTSTKFGGGLIFITTMILVLYLY